MKNILFGVPAAAIGVIGSFQEGLDNVPGMIGSNVRRRRNINDARSGFTEGVKGLAYGISDGVSGLVTEPIEGAKKDVSGDVYVADDRDYRVWSVVQSKAVSYN